MSAGHLASGGPTPEQVVAHLMATGIESWVDQIPKWRQMPEIAINEANANRAIAATQIAKAASRLMNSTSSVLNANISGVLGHQARTAYELFFDAAWLRMHDENGKLSEQFMTWNTVAMYEINDSPGHGTETVLEARKRFGDRLNNPDQWTAIEGETNVTNPNNRRQAVAAKLEQAGMAGMSDAAQQMFKMLNLLSHGMTATTIGGNIALTSNIMTGCYLTVQECQAWLLGITGRFPDGRAQHVAEQLYDLAANCLKSNS